MHIVLSDQATKRIWADFDTRCDADVIDTALARQLKDKYKFSWGAHGGSYKVMGGGTLTPEGSLKLNCEVASRDVQHRIPRRLNIDLECEITAAPAGIVLGLPTLLKTGLLQAVLTESPAGFPDMQDTDGVDDWGDEIPDSVVWPTIAAKDPALRARMMALVKEYPDVFGPAPYGGSKLEPLHIEVDSEKLAGYRPDRARAVSPAVLEDIRYDVNLRMENGWLVPGTSRFASAVVAAKQPGKPRRRCCGDYRAINQMTVPVAYPCKNARKVVEELKGSSIFGTVDLYKGYFQLKVSEETSELLAVVTPDGLYKPSTAPFGPKQVPAAFQRRISEQVLQELEGRGMSSYIDDICLHASTPDEFLSNLKKLLDRLREFDLRLNGAKCILGGDEVDFLGMTVDGQGVRHMDKRKAAMANLCPPRNRKQLRSFLGMAGYFRSHISNFARKTKPLTLLTSQAAGDKEAGFRPLWGEAQAAAFSEIKQDMLDVKMLKFLDYSKKISIRTDASIDGCGAVMFQLVDGIERPVAYLSKTFTDAERRWSTIEQETFAVYYAITSWQDYLLGHMFEVETDHRNILWLYKSSAPKILRWRLRLQEYDFNIKHVAGRDNVVADGLSRVGHHVQPPPAAGAAMASMAIVLSGRTDPLMASMAQPRSKDFVPNPETLHIISTFHNDVVGHRHARAIERQMLGAGHGNHEYLRDHTDYFVLHCPLCQKLKFGTTLEADASVHISASEVGEEWSVDTIGPLPPDVHGNTFIIAAVDGFSRLCLVKPAKSTAAAEAATFLLELAGIFGLPARFRTDNGSQYNNTLIEALLALVGTERYPGIPYRPQSNSLIERANKEIVQHLRFILVSRRVRDQWSEYLPLVQRIINASYNSSIGTAPARIVFGDRVNLDRMLVPQSSQAAQAVIANIQDRSRRLHVSQYIHDLTEAQSAIAAASAGFQQQQLERNSALSCPATLEPQEWVCATWPNGRRPTKLSVLWKGPFRVVGLKPGSGSVYVVQDPADQKEYEFHVTRLRRFSSALTADPAALIALDTEEYVVEEIVDHNFPSGNKSWWDFKVRWQGLPSPEEDSWIPWVEAKKLTAMDAYRKQHPELGIPPS